MSRGLPQEDRLNGYEESLVEAEGGTPEAPLGPPCLCVSVVKSPSAWIANRANLRESRGGAREWGQGNRNQKGEDEAWVSRL